MRAAALAVAMSLLAPAALAAEVSETSGSGSDTNAQEVATSDGENAEEVVTDPEDPSQTEDLSGTEETEHAEELPSIPETDDADEVDEGIEMSSLTDTPTHAPGWAKIDGTWYFFDEAGVMQTGWIEHKGSRYYLNSSGAMLTGWIKLDGTWYYLTSSGAMKTGWIKLKGTWYYLASSGAMKTGWVKLKGTWYYLASSGAMQTGWIKLSGMWYYLTDSGAMKTGWVKLKGTWYYLASSGAMQTGWIKLSGTWYYLKSSGAMVTGSHTIDGKVSSFARSGKWLGYGYRFGMQWVAQQTNYWCGPASGYSVLAALGYSRSTSGVQLSQRALASNSYMETDRYGRTAFAYQKFAVGMNRWMGVSAYAQRKAPTTAFLRDKVLSSFSAGGVPVVVDTQEWASGAHYNNHPRVTFSHLMPVEGYSPSTDTLTIIDPAAHFYYYNGAKNVFTHKLSSFTPFLQDYGIYY